MGFRLCLRRARVDENDEPDENDEFVGVGFGDWPIRKGGGCVRRVAVLVGVELVGVDLAVVFQT